MLKPAKVYILSLTFTMGKVFDGVLLINGGLCQYESGEYRLLSHNHRYSLYATYHELYINHLYNTCSTNFKSFIAWMVDVHHYSVDGWIVENLKRYINDNDRLTAFFQRFANVYNYDTDMLTQCSIDMIDHYKQVASSQKNEVM